MDTIGECKVSIISITYNQNRYLQRAVDSFLAQKTDFEFEIILHDDASTDGTRDIVQAYADKYPGKVRAYLEKENQYSKGVDFVAELIRNAAKGQYIALCEGDDFWMDEHKLQRQYDALEAHPECDMCACRGCTVTEDGQTVVSEIRPADHDCILPVEDVIKGGGQYLVSAGLFFRKSLFDEMLPFEKVIPLDYEQQIKGALRGGIYYIDKTMAAYRRYAEGSWTNDVLRKKERLKLQWAKEIALLKQLDVDTHGKYHDAIVERLKAYTPFGDQLESHGKEIEKVLENVSGNVFIWGRGRRGSSLEEYCRKHKIRITGVCDVINTCIGEDTESGNRIYHTDEVKGKADVILASNLYAYNDLIAANIKAEIIDFQQFMPWG